MKKYLLIAFCSIALGLIATAQNSSGDKNLNIGIGVGSPIYIGYTKASIPPVGASFEMSTSEDWSFGGYLGFAQSKWETYDLKYNYLIFGGRASYHFSFLDIPNTDLYGGGMLGYHTVSLSGNNSYGGPSSGSAIYGIYAGGRYRFNEHLGAFAEVGYGIAYLQLGVNFKL